MKFQSELSYLKKAAGCAVIFLGVFGAATGLSVVAHADDAEGGGGIYWDGEFLGGGDDWDWGGDDGDWDGGDLGDGGDGVASLGEADDECGESTEESRC